VRYNPKVAVRRQMAKCVLALPVTMQVSLLERPFVPSNLMPNAGSPVPLIKLQIVPRLRLLTSSGCVWVKPKFRSHRNHELPHTPYVRDCRPAQFHRDGFSVCFV
jgi:hypothetical protein